MSRRYYGKGGYRPGYSEAHSPNYAAGHADGTQDKRRIEAGKEPMGPTPLNPAYPVMYNRGYQDGLNGIPAL